MTSVKSNSEKLRMAAAAQGILSIAALARLIPCSPTSVYFCLERPSRFPRVAKRIKELTHFTPHNS